MSDCVEQLQLLEEMGRVWGQSMLLEVQAPKLLLTDIETKVSAKKDRQTIQVNPQRQSGAEGVPRGTAQVVVFLVFQRGDRLVSVQLSAPAHIQKRSLCSPQTRLRACSIDSTNLSRQIQVFRYRCHGDMSESRPA